MIALLVAATFQSLPAPPADKTVKARLRNVGTVISPDDYPLEAMRRSEAGIVSLLLHVSPAGRVIACDITETSGSATLDAVTCEGVTTRERFDPARDAEGTAIAGNARLMLKWGIDANQPVTAFNVPLTVANLPASYKRPVNAELVFDATGRIATCDVLTTSGSAGADRAACAYLREKFTIAAPKSGSSSVSAAAVRSVTVTLSEGDGRTGSD